VEILEVLLILGVFLPLLFVGVWQLNRLNPNRKAMKAGDSSIKELYKVFNDQVTDVLKLKDKQISSLMAKLRNYEEDLEVPEEKGLDLTALAPILKEKGIDPAILEIPFIKDKIKDFTKGMSIQDLLGLVNQFGKVARGGKSESGIDKEFPNIEYN